MFLVRAAQIDNSPIPLEKDRFAQLPIRIGRNTLNDVCLNHGLVSAFHARIEDIDGKICLRDLGSKNGLFIPAGERSSPVRLAPDAVVDLASIGFQFFVAPAIRLKIEVISSDAPFRASHANGQVLGNASMLGDTPPPWNAGSQPPPGMPLPAHGANAPHPGAVYPWSQPPGAAHPSAPPPQYAPPAQRPPQAGARPTTQFFNMGLDAMALQGLRELAGSLTPGSPLETTGDLARFITKLHDTVDVFCRCFIPLRDGYAQFVSSLDLQQAASQRSLNRSPASVALETASSPDAIANALLNARDRSFDAPAAIEGILADLMLHQVALLDGVMQGVKALLDELSPESIEAALHDRNQLGLLGGGNKARWQEYRERFERLVDEKQAFSLIFGRQFTQVYRQYWQKQNDGDGDQRLRTDRPRG